MLVGLCQSLWGFVNLCGLYYAFVEFCQGSVRFSILFIVGFPYYHGRGRNMLVQVDVSEEEDEFQTVISGSLSVLLLAVETRLDAPLQQMVRQPWANLEAVRPLGGNSIL